MTTIAAADACHVIVAAIRIAWIACIVVFGYYAVFILGVGQTELAFAVGHPDAKLVAAERSKHHAIVLWDGEADKLVFDFWRL